MRDYSELELIALASVGFSDVSLAPDVVLELIAENKRLRAGMKGDFCLDSWLDWAQEAEALRAKTETYCTYGEEGSEHTYYGDKAAIAALTALVFEVEALRQDAKGEQP